MRYVRALPSSWPDGIIRHERAIISVLLIVVHGYLLCGS